MHLIASERVRTHTNRSEYVQKNPKTLISSRKLRETSRKLRVRGANFSESPLDLLQSIVDCWRVVLETCNAMLQRTLCNACRGSKVHQHVRRVDLRSFVGSLDRSFVRQFLRPPPPGLGPRLGGASARQLGPWSGGGRKIEIPFLSELKRSSWDSFESDFNSK